MTSRAKGKIQRHDDDDDDDDDIKRSFKNKERERERKQVGGKIRLEVTKENFPTRFVVGKFVLVRGKGKFC